MPKAQQNFAVAMRGRQLAWALHGNIPTEALEQRKRKISWVLKYKDRRLNLFRPEWWDRIKDSEHRWARALTSSQCFAVNLFAPLANDPVRIRRVLNLLLPDRTIEPQDSIAVHFEHTPEGAPGWLGERGQPTQVDVFLEITRGGQPIGFVLIEVKFMEASFGSCRGWNGKVDGNWANPDRTRCEDVVEIAASPASRCWLSDPKGERRQYWQLMAKPTSSLGMERIGRSGACPFRYGLYQMMRNRVLADELVSRTPGAWAEFAVCRHPENDAVANMKVAVRGKADAFDAFRELSSATGVRDWNAEELVSQIGSTDDQLAHWETWIRKRYFRS